MSDNIIRTYSELIKMNTFKDRVQYLKLDGVVGETTYGFDRWINQMFYKSKEWRQIRTDIISRDLGCDLGIPGREILGKIFIHHLNPIMAYDIVHAKQIVFDPEYLITCSFDTHNFIHYGRVSAPNVVIERQEGDTKLW